MASRLIDSLISLGVREPNNPLESALPLSSLSGIPTPLRKGAQVLGRVASAGSLPIEVTGQPVENLGVGIPESKWDAALGLAGALPVSRAIKPIARAASGSLQNVVRSLGVTAEDIYAAKARPTPPGATMSDFLQSPNYKPGTLLNPEASIQPVAQTGLPRYEPARGTTPRLQDAIRNTTLRKRIMSGVEEGGKMVEGNWYNPAPAKAAWEQYSTNPSKDYALFQNTLAATSPGQKITDNIRAASNYYHKIKQGGRIFTDNPPPGYGAKTQQLHKVNVNEFLASPNQEFDPLLHPKVSSFTQNLSGNYQPVTQDKHNVRAIGMLSQDPRWLKTTVEDAAASGKSITKPREAFQRGELTMKEALKNPTYWEDAPAKNEYGAMEKWQQGIADKMGLSPADYQGKLWVGKGGLTGLGSTPETVSKSIEARVLYTAWRTGENPQAILRKFVTGKIPLLSIPAAVGVGASGIDQGKEAP